MKITQYAISKKTVSYFVVLILIGGGILAYQGLGQLEFPSFTIKTAVVATPYPGASAEEVEQEVTDLIETAIQQMAQVDEVRSISQTGLSIIYVDIKNQYFSDAIPQIWDELRRKVSDAQIYLPPGAGPAIVNDDFGDVYGVFFAVTGDGYTYEELKDYVDFLKRELLLVKDVASVDIWGNQQENINLIISRARLAELGISMQEIVNTLNLQNQVVDSGRVEVASDEIRINPNGEFTTVDDLAELLVRSDAQGNLIYLKDVVEIERGYADPPNWVMQYNSKPALGLGIATVDGGNVVDMGKAVRERIQELEAETPVGMELGIIAYQSDLVSASIKNFVINLAQAVAIVITVLCVTMGLASGMLMGAILLLTILGTFIFMQIMGIDFHIISLGALILALGMLVDNAIVVTEGILIHIQQGMQRKQAATETVAQTAWPLLGATIVAILAFAAIGTSKDVTGEFLMSLFLVMAASLGLSWILAITLTPLFCVQFLPRKKTGKKGDPYSGRTYRLYKDFLSFCLHHRALSLTVLMAMLAASIYGFGFVGIAFFPNDSRNQFMVDYWRPQGTHIDRTAEDMEKIGQYLAGLDQVIDTTAFVGQGALRFLLSYDPQMPNTSYGQFLVTVKDSSHINALIPDIRAHIMAEFPDSQVILKRFVRGPGGEGKIQARFSGPDASILRELSGQAQKIMATDPVAADIRDNWRQQVPVVRPQVADATARRLGITRPQIADAIAMNYSGKTIGLYREENKLIPMVIKASEAERSSVDQLDDIVVLSPATGRAVAVGQVTIGMQLEWEDAMIHRKNRQRTITAQCDPLYGNANPLFNRLRPQIEVMDLPPGYNLSWGGEYESQGEAQASLFQMVPVFFLAMVFMIVLMFNAARQTIIIFLCLPLATIGVTVGLLVFNEPFGFMCILGFLGLSGMLIKNAVVLIDQIDLEIQAGKQPFAAILDSSVSRLRPVTMAALTTVLGMLPLLKDVFYVGMSVTIMGGLTFGTVLTLVIVPVLYSVFFGIKPDTMPAREDGFTKMGLQQVQTG
jgi:multidrug efflux pump subunit AcrB